MEVKNYAATSVIENTINVCDLTKDLVETYSFGIP